MPLRYETKITPEQRELFKSNAKQSNFIKIANIVATDYFDLSIDELGLYSTLLCLDSLKNFKDWFNTKLKYSGMCKGYFLKNYRNLKEKGLLLSNGKPNPDYLVDSMKWPTDQTGEIDKGYFIVSVDAILDLEMPHSAKGLYTAFCYAIPKTDTVVSAGFMLKICNITKNTFTKYFQWLEDHKYIVRERSFNDGRLFEYKLFAKPYETNGSFNNEISYIETRNYENYQTRIEKIAFLTKKHTSQVKNLVFKKRNLKSIRIEPSGALSQSTVKRNDFFIKVKSVIGNGPLLVEEESVKVMKKVISKLNFYSCYKLGCCTKFEAANLFLKMLEILKSKIIRNKEGYIYSLITNTRYKDLNLSVATKKKYLIHNMKLNFAMNKIHNDEELYFIKYKFLDIPDDYCLC